ncbi:MAG: phosphotransferase, partial [Spirochaetota bacterium]
NNNNYKIETSTQSFLLKVYLDKMYKHIVYETKLLLYLKQESFLTAAPLPNRLGKYITTYGITNIVLFEFLSGTEPKINENSVSLVAENLSRLHIIKPSRRYKRKSFTGIESCRLLARMLPMVPPYIQFVDYFITFTELFLPFQKVKIQQGLTHGDLFTNNTVLTGNGNLAFIDFENSSFSNLLYDLGIAINGFCFLNHTINWNLVKVFITKYLETSILNYDEKDLLGIYIIAGVHGIIGWHIKLMLERPKSNERHIERITYLIERVKTLWSNRLHIERQLATILK